MEAKRVTCVGSNLCMKFYRHKLEKDEYWKSWMIQFGSFGSFGNIDGVGKVKVKNYCCYHGNYSIVIIVITYSNFVFMVIHFLTVDIQS